MRISKTEQKLHYSESCSTRKVNHCMIQIPPRSQTLMRLHSFTFEGDSCAASLTSAQLFLSLCSEPVYTVANSRELLQLLTSKEESKVFGVTLDVISLKKGNSVAPFQRMLSVAFCGKKCQQSSTMEKTERGKLKLLSFSSHLTAQLSTAH